MTTKKTTKKTRKKLDMTKLNRKTIKRFTKKELIALSKKNDFGLESKITTKDTKASIVQKLLKGKNFACVAKVITLKPKRTQTVAQKQAFAKMRGSISEQITEIKNTVPEISNEAKEIMALRKEIEELKKAQVKAAQVSIEAAPGVETQIESGQISSIADLAKAINIDDEKFILDLIKDEKIILEQELLPGITIEPEEQKQEPPQLEIEEQEPIDLGTKENDLRRALNANGFLRKKDVIILLKNENLSTKFSKKEEGIERLIVKSRTDAELLQELNVLLDDPEVRVQLREDADESDREKSL